MPQDIMDQKGRQLSLQTLPGVHLEMLSGDQAEFFGEDATVDMGSLVAKVLVTWLFCHSRALPGCIPGSLKHYLRLLVCVWKQGH